MFRRVGGPGMRGIGGIALADLDCGIGQNAASTLPTGLLAYWPLGEASGNRVDATLRGNDLAPSGAVVWGWGLNQHCAEFTGIGSGFLTIASNADLSPGDNDFTVVCAVRFDAVGTNAIWSKYSTTDNQRGYRLVYNATTSRFCFQVSADGVAAVTVQADNAGAAAIDTWYLIRCWYDATNDLAYIQVDTNAADSGAHAGGIFNNSATPFMVGDDDSNTPINGRVDELGVWNRILSDAEWLEWRNGGAVLTYPFDGAALPVANISISSSNACRVPHQRQCFYAAGRYWIFYSDASRNLWYASTTDNEHWIEPVNLTTFPQYDAQWSVAWDGTYLHITKVIQNGGVGLVHDGLTYRRGTLGIDGVITWDADWQIVLATGNFVGDPSLAVATDGAVWVGYKNATAGDACVVKNSAVDGTWATAAGFPVQLTITTDNRHAMVAPLAAGGIHATVYRYGTDDTALGFYSADGGAVFASEGAITASNVETNSGAGAQVGRIESASEGDGIVHLAYQTDDQKIMYRQRSALGVWGTEVELDDGTNVTAAISSPRISFNGSGEIYVMWSTAANIFMRKYSAGAWGAATAVVTESLEATFEHAMPAELTNGATLQLAYLTDANLVRHRLLTL